MKFHSNFPGTKELIEIILFLHRFVVFYVEELQREEEYVSVIES